MNDKTNADISNIKEESEFVLEQPWNELLKQPLNDIVNQTPIAHNWSMLAATFNYWLNVPDETFNVIAENMQRYRNAEILFEAMQNNSAAVARNAHDISFVISSYHYVLYDSLTEIFKFKNEKVITVCSAQMQEICRARLLEQNWRDGVTFPTEEDYLQMVVKKTSGLLTMQLKLMQIFSKNQKNVTKLAEIFGLYFQILDDYQCLTADYNSEKYCEDITLGRFNFLVIHGVTSSNPTKKDAILRILRQKTENKMLKKYVTQLLHESGSFEYTKLILMELRHAALQEIEKLGKNVLIDEFIKNYFNTSFDFKNAELESYTFLAEKHVSWDKLHKNITDKTDTIDQEILRPLKHFMKSDDPRETVLKRSCAYLQIPEDKRKIIGEISVLLQEVVLLVDDIQDCSPMRRGIPASYTIYGASNSLNTLNYVYAEIFKLIATLNGPQLILPCMTSLMRVSVGQAMDIYWRDNVICPTEEEYIRMIERKTGGLCMLTAKLVQLSSPICKDITKLANMLGIYLQVNDDYQNLTNESFFSSKMYAEDVTEGKFSFPIVHAINSHPQNGRLIMEILRTRTYDINLKKRCVSLIKKCGSLDYSDKKIKELKNLIRKESLAVLGDNEEVYDMRDFAFNFHEKWSQGKSQSN